MGCGVGDGATAFSAGGGAIGLGVVDVGIGFPDFAASSFCLASTAVSSLI
jgi:hypothetical protein